MPSFDVVSKTELAITLLADDAMKLRQVQELLKGYFVRRKIDPLALDFGTEERASGDMMRQVVTIRQGIDRELAKTLVKAIKDSKLKVQAAIQGDELRISGKNRDDLQSAIALIKQQKADRPLQFVNFRD